MEISFEVNASVKTCDRERQTHKKTCKAINFNKLYDKTEYNKWARYFKTKLFLLVSINNVIANKTKKNAIHTICTNVKWNYKRLLSKVQVCSCKAYWSVTWIASNDFTMIHASNLYLLIAR